MLGMEMLAECMLLEPVSLELTVVRNLSIQWYHDSAAIEIAGKLDRFSVRSFALFYYLLPGFTPPWTLIFFLPLFQAAAIFNYLI